MTTDIRAAEPADVLALAGVWHDGWHEAHAPLLPAELTRLRSRESFVPRLQAMLREVWTAGPLADPLGFCAIKQDELYQLYVSAEARGTGLADRLLQHAENRIAAGGHRCAWLACAIGNQRAARFYERNGWVLRGTMQNAAETAVGPYLLTVWRYEKVLMATA